MEQESNGVHVDTNGVAMLSSEIDDAVAQEREDVENAVPNDPAPELIQDIVEFLKPDTRLDVRREALKIVLSLSSPMDGSAERTFKQQEFLLGKALCTLCEATSSDRSPCLSALNNFSSVSATVADFILNHRPAVLRIAYDTALGNDANGGEVGARLLANLSRQFPGETHLKLLAHDPKVVENIVDKLSTNDARVYTTLGYSLVNMASVSRIRKQLAERKTPQDKSLLHQLYPVMQQREDQERQTLAAATLRNCCFDDSLHASLLDDSDDFICALVSPITDSGDDLDDEETGKLPLRLQYFEGTRSTDSRIRRAVVESLYQLCATRHGREMLRQKGIYPLLREFDKAQAAETTSTTGQPPSGNDRALIEHALHSVIGVLIRYEDEMGVDPALETIRDLE